MAADSLERETTDLLRELVRFNTVNPPGNERPAVEYLRDLLAEDLRGRPIAVAGHCYGCTAGQGSSCGGALSGQA